MLHKQEFYEQNVWPDWIDRLQRSSNPIVFLHGTMGSELYDANQNHTRWLDLDIWYDIGKLRYGTLSPDGAVDSDDQFIYARSTVRPPIVSRPYSNLLSTLRAVPFCYDWRESIPLEVKRLRRFLQLVLQELDAPLSFVTHSMGGCMLMYLLEQYSEFDDAIANVVFCAPPFHGALSPIRVIEDGDGIPVDFLVNNAVLRQAVGTMTGLFQLMAAPPSQWVHQIDGGPGLLYPLRTDISAYSVNFWRNNSDAQLRSKVLRFAQAYHQDMWQNMPAVLDRLGEKIQVIVALDGKTPCSVTRTSEGAPVLHKAPKAPQGKVSNGDGTVLFQSSVIPGLPKERYWADVPAKQKNTHGSFVDSHDVLQGIQALLNRQEPAKLAPYDEFLPRIDWSAELVGARTPGHNDELSYQERAKRRSLTPMDKWGSKLNPGRNDAVLFHTTREAALRVLAGEDIQVAARRIGQPVEFLEDHIKALIMPMLFA